MFKHSVLCLYMVDRLITLPLCEDTFQVELFYLAKVNGYQESLVDNILEKIYKKKNLGMVQIAEKI